MLKFTFLTPKRHFVAQNHRPRHGHMT